MTSTTPLNQFAFVTGSCVGDNIMLAQSLFQYYHRDSGTPRFAMKIDIRKAFDSLNWSFLCSLGGHGFSFGFYQID